MYVGSNQLSGYYFPIFGEQTPVETHPFCTGVEMSSEMKWGGAIIDMDLEPASLMMWDFANIISRF